MFFILLYGKTKKMQANHPVWDNGTTLPQTFHLGVFQYISNQSVRKYGKHSIWENENLTQLWETKRY